VIKISAVATVLNEEASIALLLDSLLSQTKPPDEIVIVDGGSQDSTYEILKKYAEKYTFVKVMQLPGSLAEGRNAAAQEALGDIIVQTDAGCIPNSHWIEKLTNAFSDRKTDVVAGYYDMEADSKIAQAAVPFHGVPRSQIDPRSFLPTGRSIAYKKDLFLSLGGYSTEVARGGEDIDFDTRLLKSGANIVRAIDALVIWRVPRTFLETIKRFATYAHSDAQSGVWWHPGYKLSAQPAVAPAGAKVASLVLLPVGIVAPFSLWLFLMSFVILSFWSIWHLRDQVYTFGARVYIPLVQVLADATLIVGFLYGVALRNSRKGSSSLMESV